MAAVGLGDHDDIPVTGAVKIHPDVCLSWGLADFQHAQDERWGRSGSDHPPMVWHWCDRTIWIARGLHLRKREDGVAASGSREVTPHWMPALPSLLDLERGVVFNDCCGMRVRAGDEWHVDKIQIDVPPPNETNAARDRRRRKREEKRMKDDAASAEWP